MSGTLGQRQPSQVVIPAARNGGLKKMPPYWYPYTTMAKERWLGREILEIVSTEFRDRSMEYYVRAPSCPSQPLYLDSCTFLRSGTLWSQVSQQSTEKLQSRTRLSGTVTVSSEGFSAIKAACSLLNVDPADVFQGTLSIVTNLQSPLLQSRSYCTTKNGISS